MLFPEKGQPLSAKFSGPYKVLKKVSNTTYVISTPDKRRPQRLSHVNSMKSYVTAPVSPSSAPVCANVIPDFDEDRDVLFDLDASTLGVWRLNPDVLTGLEEKLNHIPGEQRSDIINQLSKHPDIIRDRPGRTNLLVHDIEVVDSKPIRQAQYRVNPCLRDIMAKEIKTMLEWGLITPGMSEWTSPCILVPKPDGTHRFCID